LDHRYYSYQWHVRARDLPAKAESGWGESRNFTIDTSNRRPSISFDTANGSSFSSGRINTRERNWVFRGTASDPEGHLNRVLFRCDGDNCGSHHNRSGLSNWTYERHGMAGKNDVYFKVYDDAGYYRYSRHLTLRIDRAAPTTRISLNGESNTSRWLAWFTGPVQVHLNATDGNTGRARVGVKETHYRVDGDAWQTRSGNSVQFTASSDGAHTVEYYAVDKVGNTETTRATHFQIDQTPPSAPSGVVETHGVAHDVWQKAHNTPTFTWDASTDATSGVWGYQFYFGKHPNGTGYQNFTADQPRQWTPQPGGVHTGVYHLRGRTRDHAGNWSAWTDLYTFRYDETPPQNPTGVTHAAAITSTLWQRITNTADFTWPVPHDEGSGIQGYYAYWGADPGGTTTDLLASAAFQDATPLCATDAVCTGYLRLRSVDNVDNLANEWSTGFVLRYDNVPPTVTFTFDGGVTTTNQTRVTLDVTGSDEGSGVRAMRFSTDGRDWLPWETYTTTRNWVIPGISRQHWPVYVQVRDGVGLESDVISRTVYLDVNREQPRSTNFRLFDHTLSAGAGAFTSTAYTAHGTVGQIADAATVTSTNFQLSWGYEAGSQAIPLVVPGHDNYNFVNSVFGSGTGAATMTSTHFAMLGTFNEVGLPSNTTTLTSTSFTHQPGFLAAAPTVRPPQQPPVQTIGPPPPSVSELPCETPYVRINGDDAFTGQLTATLGLCAPRAVEMMISNKASLVGASWEPYTVTRTWTLSGSVSSTSARYVYAAFRDETGTVYETYFDDIIYETNVPTITLMLNDGISMPLAQAYNHSPNYPIAGVAYPENVDGDSTQPLTLPAANTGDAIPIYVGSNDDNSGIAEIQFSDNLTFTSAVWEPFAPVKYYTPPDGEGFTTVYARGRDNAGNVSPVVTTTFIYDSQPPEGDVVFDQFSVISDTITDTLYLDAWDNWSDVTDVRISANPAFTDTFWQPYTYTLVVPLSLTMQTHYTLYAQYRDQVGHVSAIYSDTLLVDTEPPVVYVDVALEDTTLTGTLVLSHTLPITTPVRIVTIYAYDDLSGVTNRYISNDPLMIEGVITLPYTSTVTWIFDESHIAWIQVEDGVGNLSEPYPAYAPEIEPYKVYLPLLMKQ
jgi:hypothetical protein